MADIKELKAESIGEAVNLYQVEKRFGKRTLINEGGMFSGETKKPLILEPLSPAATARRNSISQLDNI